VLLLPFQVSVLATPSPAVTPTNLLYNVVATPGAAVPLLAAGPDRRAAGPGAHRRTLPGVVAGSVIRVKLIPGPRVFDLVVAAVMIPLGTWLVLTRPAAPESRAVPPADPGPRADGPGRRGGVRGRDLRNRGGAFLAPVLIGSGRKPSEAAPAALAATFVTSAGA